MNGSVVYLIWIFEVQWGLNQIETSFLFLFIILIFLFAILLGGRIVDRFGSKKILVTSQLIMITSGIFFITLALISSFFIFYVACFITAIGLAFFQTAGNTQISHVIEKEKPELKGSGFGINNTIGFFCGAIGPIFVSYLGTISIYFPFYIVTFIVVLTLILTLKYIAT